MLFIKQLLRFAFFLLLTTAFVSCSDDDDEPTEFIATDASFSGFASFTLEKTFTGIAGSLGPAHGGNDATSTRKVYFKNDQDPSNNKYPVGTIIVKHVTHTSGTANEYVAMVKRGNNFNPTGGDWEWFILNADGTIAKDLSTNAPLRGANLFSGACTSCHSAASTRDYVFTK